MFPPGRASPKRRKTKEQHPVLARSDAPRCCLSSSPSPSPRSPRRREEVTGHVTDVLARRCPSAASRSRPRPKRREGASVEASADERSVMQSHPPSQAVFGRFSECSSTYYLIRQTHRIAYYLTKHTHSDPLPHSAGKFRRSLTHSSGRIPRLTTSPKKTLPIILYLHKAKPIPHSSSH